MTLLTDTTGWSGLQFFGKTTASVSHELKNALAIIKENAGLLNDYLLMMEKGMPLQPDRVKLVAGRIDQQTERADELIRHLNRFGHSVDEASASVDLNEMLELHSALSMREVSMQQATVHIEAAATPVVVKTTPICLLTLLGHCLSFALQVMGPGRELVVRISKVEDGAAIRFERLAAMKPCNFPGEAEAALLEAMGATCRMEPEKESMEIKLLNC